MAYFNKRAARIAGISTVLALVSSTALADSTVSLRILETTDIHTHLVNYDYYRDGASDTVGLAKVATLLKTARGEVATVGTFDMDVRLPADQMKPPALSQATAKPRPASRGVSSGPIS